MDAGQRAKTLLDRMQFMVYAADRREAIAEIRRLIDAAVAEALATRLSADDVVAALNVAKAEVRREERANHHCDCCVLRLRTIQPSAPEGPK